MCSADSQLEVVRPNGVWEGRRKSEKMKEPTAAKPTSQNRAPMLLQASVALGHDLEDF